MRGDRAITVTKRNYIEKNLSGGLVMAGLLKKDDDQRWSNDRTFF